MYNQKPLSGDLLDYGDPLTQGLVGYWLLNEGSGNKVFDLSGNGHIGDFTNTPVWVAGLHGSAVEFASGDSDLISGTFPDITLPITIVTVFRTVAAGTSRSLCLTRIDSDNFIYSIDANVGNDFSLHFRDGVLNTPAFNITHTGITPSANTWYMMAGVIEANYQALYVDGVFLESKTSSITEWANTHFGIGAFYRQNPVYSDITQGFCALYNHGLTSSEIALLYQRPFRMIRTRRRRIITEDVAGAPPTTFPYYYREIASRRIA